MIPRLKLQELSHRLPRGAWQKGCIYARKDHVLSLELSGSRLQADVAGRRQDPYDVIVDLTPQGRLDRADCSCPVGYGGRCKHVAAVLVAWSEDLCPVVMFDHKKAPQAVLPETEAALLEWADERDLTVWLDRSALLLQSARTRHLRFALVRSSLADAVLGRTPLGRGERVLTTLAWEQLQALVPKVESQLKAEVQDQARRAAGPTLDTLGPLWEQGMTLRDRMRDQTGPDGAMPGTQALDLHPDLDVLVYTEERPPDCDRTSGRAIHLPLSGPGQLEPSCECDDPPPACPRRLRALDALLDLVVDPTRSVEQAPLAHYLTQPAWQRSIEAVARAMAPPEPTQGRRLGWELQGQEPPWGIHAVTVRALKTRPGFQRTAAGRHQVDSEDLAQEASDPSLLSLAPRGALAIRADLWSLALPLLAGHPRVFLKGRRTPLRVLRSTLSVRAEPGSTDGVRMLAMLDSVLASKAQLQALFEHRQDGVSACWSPDQDTLHVVVAPAATWRTLIAFVGRAHRLPSEALGPLLAQREALANVLPLRVAPALRGTALAPSPRVQVRAELLPGPVLVLRLRFLPLPGHPMVVPGAGEAVLYGTLDGERAHVERDLDEERARAEALAKDLDLPIAEGWTWTLADPDQALSTVSTLQAQAEVEVLWAQRMPRLEDFDDETDLTLSVEQRPGWFSLGGEVSLGDLKVPLSEVMEAVLDGRRFVQAGAGRWARLTEPFQARIASLARVIHARGDDLEVPLSAAPVLDAAAATVQACPAFQLPLDRLREATTLCPETPAGLLASLRPYQQEGFTWLARLAHWSTGACLADDMGLGKTVQALALVLHRRGTGPTLVVAPTSVGPNWVSETERFAPSLTPRSYRGPARARMLQDIDDDDVLITSYALLSRDIQTLSGVPWGTVILDEAQALKNPRTQRARAARRLETGFLLALSGTPVENRVEELWSLFRLLVPGLLGSAERFRERFVRPLAAPDPEPVQRALAGLIRPFLLRRRKDQVALDLPPRTEILVPVTLSGRERALYDRVRRAALEELDDDNPDATWRIRALTALTRPRQLSCHPRLVLADSKVPSAKLARALELLRDLRDEGHRALVFSQFTSHLALLREALDAEGFTHQDLDGSMTSKRRQAQVAGFQGGEGDVFLISLKAGGTGLNLTAASYVLHMDPWWNPAVEDQATDRAHRIGQVQPVTVYRLVAEDTVEQGMLALQESKRALADALMAGTGSAQPLSPEDLLALLAGE